MRVKYTDFWQEPFEVGIEKLENVIKHLPPNFELKKVDVKCIDNFEREFRDLDELSEYRNHKGKAISQIDLCFEVADSSTFRESTGYLLIGRGNKQWTSQLAQISLELKGEENQIEPLKQKIGDEISTWFPQYWWLYKSKKTEKYMHYLIPAFSLLVIYVGLYTNGYSLIIDPETPNWFEQMLIWSAVIVVFTVLLALGISFVINYIQAKYFPTETFLIGEGCVRAQKLNQTRKWIAYFLIAGIVVPILVGWFVT